MTADLMRAADALARQAARTAAPAPRGAAEAWGTVREHDGALYVQVDGSSVWTPCKALVEARAGDRVRVRIERHSYTVTGNATSPGASQGSVAAARDETDRLAAVVAANDAKATEAIGKINTDELPAIRDAVQDAAHDITVIDTRLQVVDGALKGIEYEAGQIRDGLDGAREAADGAVAAIDEATRAVLAALRESYEVETEAATMGGALGTLVEASAAGIGSKVSRDEYQRNSDEVNGAIGELSGRLYGAEGELEELRRIEAQARADLDAANAAASAARAELDELLASETSPEVEAAIEAKRAQVAALSAQASSAEAALNEAQAAVAAAQGDIATLLGLIKGMGDRITSAESSFEQTATDITLTFEEKVSAIEAMTGGMDDTWKQLLTYFAFTIDGLRIGKAGSPFSTVITNDDLSFLEGGAPVAHIGNRSMYISRAEIVQQLAIGGWKLDQRPNGNLALRYRGE